MNNNHWLADKDYTTKNKVPLPKILTRLSLIFLSTLFIGVSFQNPSTGQHILAEGKALRSATSFIELGAGCVASTEWVNYKDYTPKESLLSGSFYSDALLEKYIDIDSDTKISAEEAEAFFDMEGDFAIDFGVDNKLYSDNWDSYPPAWGDYANKDWEGAPIVANYNTYTLQLNGMGFADGLRKLYQGANVIWYHPRLSDVTKSYILQELDSAVTSRIVEKKEEFYLHPLPIAQAQYDDFPRNIYYTKLGFTQSCSEFDIRVFDSFYK